MSAQLDRRRPVAVFDLDGTLVDTAPDLAASLNHCLRRTGLKEIALSELRPHAGHGARVMLEFGFGRAGHALDEAEVNEQAEIFLAYYREHIIDFSCPFPGALDTLDRFEEAGFLLAVCTNKSEAMARLLLECLGVADRFSAICGADTFARRKPDPLHLLLTIEAAGGTCAGSIMIGDTSTDTAVAKAAGVPSILLDFGYCADDVARAEATVVVASFADIKQRLWQKLSRSA